MALIVSATGLVGLGASFGMLMLGLESMAIRYPVAVVVAYGAFLVGVRLWLRRFRSLERRRAKGAIGLDAVDLPVGDVGGGSGGDGHFAAEFAAAGEAALVFVALAIVFVLGYVVWSAPSIFAEVALDAALSAGLYRRLRRDTERGWLTSAIRRTIIPALIVIALAFVGGLILQTSFPGASSVGSIIQQMR